MTDEKNILGIIGLCRGAGRAIIGVPMICEALKKRAGRDADSDEVRFIVVEASDTSENTHKRIVDKCSFYKVRHIRLKADCDTLGRAVGKGGAVAAVAINDVGFCRALLMKLS